MKELKSKMPFRCFLIVVFAMLAFLQTSAQDTKTLTGIVTDERGDPIIGATVFEVGTTNGTVTDIEGQYAIEINKGATLRISFVGMIPYEFLVEGQNKMDVSLDPDIIGLEDIVVIGYGTSKKSDLTGAISSISSDELLDKPITRIEEGLQGKVAGVRVQNADGAPGSALKVRIRGASSISFSNEPLYVVDGFIGADINSINPKDIASIDILKDASASAIYGSRGANGVIIITTNKARAGKMKVSLDASYGISNVPHRYEMSSLDSMMSWLNQEQVAKFAAPVFDEADMEELLAQGPTDWQGEMLQKGKLSDINLSVSGGSDETQYYISGSYHNVEGVIKNSSYTRYSLRSNINSNIYDWLDMTFNTYATTEKTFGPGRMDGGQYSPWGKAFKYPRVWPAYDSLGAPVNPVDMDDYSGTMNPLRRTNPLKGLEYNSDNFRNTIQSNLDLNFRITSFLSLKVSGSGKYNNRWDGRQSIIDPPDNQRKDVTIRQRNSHNSSLMNYDVLTFHKDLGKHSLKLDAVYEFRISKNRDNSVTVADLNTLGTDYHVLDVGTPSGASSGYTEKKYRSYMGRLNYNYADKYLFTGSYRADGVSVFKSGNKWGFFPSASFAWKLSNEDFINNISAISNLKFRIGFGQVGNSAIPANYTVQRLNTDVWDYANTNLATVESAVVPGPMVDPEIIWETTTQFNTGLDFGFLGNRLSGTIDFYNKEVNDLIFNMAIPYENGATSITTNIGDLKNQGVEFDLQGVIVANSEWTIAANFNISFNQSEVLNIGNVDELFINNGKSYGIPNDNSKFIVEKGRPIGQLFGYTYQGTWKLEDSTQAALYRATPGDPRYLDVDNDSVIGENDKQAIATTIPTMHLGFGINVSYRGFDLAVNTYGAFGHEVYNVNKFYQERYNDPQTANRWTPENQTDIPKFGYYSDPTTNSLSSRYLESGNFFKISSITLGYQFSNNLLEKIKVSSARIYLTGSNLYTFTNYSGADPEGASTLDNKDAIGGIDNMAYPITRTYSLGVNFTF